MAGKQVLRIETRDRLRLGNARHVAALVRGARPAVRVRRLGSADGLGALPRLGGEGAGGRGRRCGWGNRDGPGTAGARRGHGPLTVRGPGARTRRGVPESVGRDAQGEPPSRGARGRRGLCLVSTTLGGGRGRPRECPTEVAGRHPPQPLWPLRSPGRSGEPGWGGRGAAGRPSLSWIQVKRLPGPSAGGSAIASRSCPVAPPRSSRRAAAGVSAGYRVRVGARAVKASGARSDQAEHAKADDEQEGRDQADRPSDRPELGAKAGDVGL